MWTWVNQPIAAQISAPAAGRTVREVRAGRSAAAPIPHGPGGKNQCAWQATPGRRGTCLRCWRWRARGDDFRRLRDRLARLASAGHVVSRSAFDQVRLGFDPQVTRRRSARCIAVEDRGHAQQRVHGAASVASGEL